MLAQPADTGGPGVRGPHTGAPASRPTSRPGTLDGGSRIGFPHLIPPFAAEKMKLTDDQRKQLDELAKEVKARLDKILTPEQQTEVDNFRKKTTDTKRDLKELRKNLREESERLQFWTKVINIGAVPLLVVILGVVLALVRRRKVIAK